MKSEIDRLRGNLENSYAERDAMRKRLNIRHSGPAPPENVVTAMDRRGDILAEEALRREGGLERLHQKEAMHIVQMAFVDPTLAR